MVSQVQLEDCGKGHNMDIDQVVWFKLQYFKLGYCVNNSSS